MPENAEKEPTIKDVLIATKKSQLQEEIRHFSNTAKVAKVQTEKAEAAARVEIAQAFLETLDKLGK